jgi:hypothetical protein
MLPVSFVPKVENRTSNKNGGKSSGHNTDYENECEIVDDSCPENPK